MKRFTFRRKARQQYCIIVQVKRINGSLLDQCSIGPATKREADMLTHLFNDAVGRHLGERLNTTGARIEFSTQPMLTFDDGMDWIWAAAARVPDMGTPSRLQTLRASMAEAGDAWREDVQRMFPWLHMNDEDGMVFDSTPWNRPTGSTEAWRQWRDALPLKDEDDEQ
jgi:hypothetical protein